MNKINSTKQTNKNNKKIKSQITDLIFILDRSGSMSGLEADTIGGFNSMIQKQKKENHGDKVFVTTILFDNRIKMIHDRVPLEEIKVMTENDYYVGGSTALFDAIGFAIGHENESRANLNKNEVPDNTIIVITTDGYENSSKEYNHSKIRKLIQDKKEKAWDFIFLGANIDSDNFANEIGIGKEYAVSYSSNSTGTQFLYDDISCHLSKMRYSRSIGAKMNSDSFKQSFAKSEKYNNK